jgi:membrane protease YdiL (CAAX protease family)
MNPPFRYFPPFLKSVLMFSLLLVCMSVASYTGYLSIHALFGVEKPEDVVNGVFTGANDVNAFLYVQTITSLGGFLLTAVLFALLESRKPLEHLRLNTGVELKHVALAFVSIVIAQFFIEFLVELNRKIPMPASIGSMDEHQKKIEELTNALLGFKEVSRLLVVGFVMAVVPALSEEFFFRGLLLGDLLKSKSNPTAAILISGFCFAVFHFEYDNTLAIWVLGSFLGWLYYVSGSLWLPVIAHFTNNFLAVFLKYLFNIGVISADIAEASSPWYLTLGSVVLFSGCVYLFSRWNKNIDYYEPVPEPEQEVENENYN